MGKDGVAKMEIYSCKVNHLKNPIGFEMTGTVFSWKVRNARGKKQSAARIQIALDEAFTQIAADTGFCAELDSLASPVAIELRPYTNVINLRLTKKVLAHFIIKASIFLNNLFPTFGKFS